MASVSEQLLAALDDLDTDELKRFKWHLKDHKGFSAADLKKADASDTVDLIKKRFRPQEAVKITVEILRKMNLNNLAKELENKHKQESANLLRSFHHIWSGDLNQEVETLTNTDPRTRNDFLQYSRQLSLDPNTVNKRLRLSENNRVITYTFTDQQSYPDHPDRFDYWPQVLCRESVCGRCYWELERSGGTGVFISVSYKSISRKGLGYKCAFGGNDQSWSLRCSPSSYSFWHNKIQTDLSVKSIIRRIGMCLWIKVQELCPSTASLTQ